MKKALLLLFVCSTCFADIDRIETDYGTFNLYGNVSAFAYSSPDNNLLREDSDFSLGESYAGLNINFLTNYLSFRSYLTTSDIVNYGFFELSTSIDTDIVGVRLGRVNRLSGFFSGMGPHADRMNFLPQGTNLSRTGKMLYRIQGLQFLYNTIIDRKHNLSIELSYGKVVFDDDDEAGLSGHAIHALFDPNRVNFSALYNDLYVPSIDIRYSYENWQVYADFFYAKKTEAELVVFYDADNRFVEQQLGAPPGFLGPGTTRLEQPVKVGPYENYQANFGISYSFYTVELLLMTFYQYSDASQEAVSAILADYGATLMMRGNYNPQTLLYGGFTTYIEDADDEFLASQGLLGAPEWIDYGRGIFIGSSYSIRRDLEIIGEIQFNEGGNFLNAKHQNPLTTDRYWNVYSLSLNYYF